MILQYVGPHDAVLLPLPDGREPIIERGQFTPDLPDVFAESLLEQPTNWRRKPSAKTADAPAGKE